MSGIFYTARPNRQQHYRILPIVVRYASAALSLVVTGWIAWNATHSAANILVASGVSWIVAGVVLSRAIERRLLWNNNFTTLASAARAKSSFILAWPFATPRLVWRMFVVKFL